MKKAIFTNLICIALVVFFSGTSLKAQILPCGSCGGTAFTLTMQPVSISTNGMGNVVSADLEVFFTNNFVIDFELITVPFVLGYNTTNVPSLTDVDAVAFPGVWDQGCTFPANCRLELGLAAISPAKTFPMPAGPTYDMKYQLDHTGNGDLALHPVQLMPVGVTTRIMTISMTFDGTQAFQITNAASPDFLIRPENFLIFHGECQDPDPNILNQWGFVNQFGGQLLINCFDSQNIPATSNLPLELIDFEGEVFDRYNELYWTTLSEQNTQWHVIERSGNPVEEAFIEIGRVPAAGNSENVLEYSLQDENPLYESYYRLKTVDFDGSISMSDVILLKRDAEANDLSTVLVFPNPTADEVTVKLELRGTADVTLEVVDVLGRLLETQIYPEHQGLFQKELSLENYPPGSYFIQVDTGSGFFVEKVVKQ
ncbi:MAG: T9SS type A sorting domain-containing protein [Bacteroidota bacterium]